MKIGFLNIMNLESTKVCLINHISFPERLLNDKCSSKRIYSAFF